MAEQSGERWVTAEVGAELISLIVPDVDLEHYSRSMRNCLLSSATPASTAPSSA